LLLRLAVSSIFVLRIRIAIEFQHPVRTFERASLIGSQLER